MDVLAFSLFDGTILSVAIWAGMGFLVGWFVPSPAFIVNLLGPKR